jgi:8-oxo-dGTP diphosphatase
MEPHKCAEVAWFPLFALPELMPRYERFVLNGLATDRLEPFTSFGF